MDNNTEVLEPMTPAEVEAFFNAEDEALKEDRGEMPVADQISIESGKDAEIAQLRSEIDRLAEFIITTFPDNIEGSAVDTAIKLLSDGR